MWPEPGAETVPVAIVGGGPVGLALGLGLARHGVRSVVLERDATTSAHSKAPGIHVRTLEALHAWGADEPLRAAGELVPALSLHPTDGGSPWFTVDLSALADEADRPGLLVLEQGETERLLLDAAAATGRCDVRFGADVVHVEQDGDGARVRYQRHGTRHTLSAAFAVGCDGAHSRVREALGLPFPGITYGLGAGLADVHIDDPVRDTLPWPRIHLGPHGTTLAIRLRAGLWRLIRLSPDGVGAGPVRRDQVADWAVAALGPGPFELVWASRFRLHRRSSPRFRVGRVLLAGDAAHVHSPVGGQGLNAGIQDAHNLAWKLASALSGGDAERLLASYETERRAVVVGSVTRFTDVATRLLVQSARPVRRATFAAIRWSTRRPAVHRALARRLAMLDLDCPPSALLGLGDPAAGVRLPNVLLAEPSGSEVRLHDLLPVGAALIEVVDGEDGDPAPALPVDRVIRVGPGGLRDPSGRLRALSRGVGWILVRPDAHVAWALHHRAELRSAALHALGLPAAGAVTPPGSANAALRSRRRP